MDKWEQIRKLNTSKDLLKAQYYKLKDEVRARYPYNPPSCEVMKYTKIRYKIKRIDLEIEKVARG